ncbi:MAG TPA: DUF4922 domain-containing protein [Thermoanaerobaculia bacterium]|nr:DUF4922 domain-containing protein [Thermoanaerobaculia bacterium]
MPSPSGSCRATPLLLSSGVASLAPSIHDNLWLQADRVAERARESGALVPLDSTVDWIQDAGFRFAVQVLGGVYRQRQRSSRAPGGQRNPFLPHDPALFVADLSPTHHVLLNKYPVIPRHLLVVTRAFVDQELPLGFEDFEALWRCLLHDEQPRSLGFYNSSPDAGASQRHRHLQVVALPIGGATEGTPFDAAFERAGARPDLLPELPFAHAAVRFEAPDRADTGWYAAATLDHYRLALEAVGRDPARPGAYNLLVTRRFLCVVPRCRERFGPVSVNALGFCGVLLARDHGELESLRQAGPMTALREVAG